MNFVQEQLNISIAFVAFAKKIKRNPSQLVAREKNLLHVKNDIYFQTPVLSILKSSLISKK